MTLRLLFAGVLLIGFTIPADGKSLKSVPVQLDPTKAYVVVEVGPLEGFKVPGQLTLARYDQAKLDVRGLGRAKTAPLASKADVREVTGPALLKTDARRLYLLELEPDFWIVEGANGTAFSLGSSGFALTAGSVTDLGVATVANDYGEGEAPEKLTAGKLAKAALLGPLLGGRIAPKSVPAMVSFRQRGAADLALPASLRSRATPASWSGPLRFGNYLGGLVNRMGGRKARAAIGTEAATEVAPAS